MSPSGHTAGMKPTVSWNFAQSPSDLSCEGIHFNGQEHHESPVTEESTGYLGVWGRRGVRKGICRHLPWVGQSGASLQSPPKPGERQNAAQKPMDNFILISPREDNFRWTPYRVDKRQMAGSPCKSKIAKFPFFSDILEQRYPTDLSTVMEIFYIWWCPIQ